MIVEILTTVEAAQKAEETAYKIAVDIGTTTIALELLGAKTGKKICETALVNKQRAYGADVISRIKASTEGKKEELQNCIRKDLRDGIETLLLRYGVSKEQVSHVYVAGGFGCRLDAGKAVAIGMLPKDFAEKVIAVGNSSLAGAVKYARDSNAKAWIQNLTGSAEEVSLSADRVFQEFYMDTMMFEDEEE